MTSPRPDSRLGTDLGPYRIERVLGRGGMGVVYLAEQRELGRRVALKLLAPEVAGDGAFRARFLRESRLAASIEHANIIPIYEAGEADGTSYLAMRYVEGTDLDERLKDGPLDPELAIALLAQVAGALDAAHAAGLIHRDVKPANLLLADEGGAVPHVYLTDFGLTKKRASQTGGLTRAGSALGTLEYMAPEQVEGGEVDAPADEYALACVAFQCLTGHVPFERESDVAVAMAHLRDAPPSATAFRPELPIGVDAVIARGMAKDPLARYASCASLIADLRTALGGAAIAVATPRRVSPLRRAPVAVAAVLGLALVAVVGLGWASGGLGALGSGATTPTSSAAIIASPSAVAAAPESAEPTSTTFPTAAETAFIASLPATLTDCQRVRESEAGTAAGINKRVEMSNGQIMFTVSDDVPSRIRLRCVPPSGSGADEAFVFWDPRTAGASGINSPSNPEWGPDTLLGWIAGNFQIPDGDCADSIPANGRWESAGSVRGRLVCRISDSSGKAWIYWTDNETRVFGWAGAPDGDGSGVYRWWSTTAPFIIPSEDT